MKLIKKKWSECDLCVTLICAPTLRILQKTAKRVIGRLGWTAVVLLPLLPRSLNAIQNIHTCKYIILRGCGGHISSSFFPCTHSNNIYRVDVTQRQTQERRFGRKWGEDRFHPTKTSDGPGTVVPWCKSVFTTTCHFLQCFSRKENDQESLWNS